MDKTKKIILYREVKRGRFVTEHYAERHPTTTEREVRRVPVRPKPKG